MRELFREWGEHRFNDTPGLLESVENSHHSPGSRDFPEGNTPPLPSERCNEMVAEDHAGGRRRLTEEDVREVQRLIAKGMFPKQARTEVIWEQVDEQLGGHAGNPL